MVQRLVGFGVGAGLGAVWVVRRLVEAANYAWWLWKAVDVSGSFGGSGVCLLARNLAAGAMAAFFLATVSLDSGCHRALVRILYGDV